MDHPRDLRRIYRNNKITLRVPFVLLTRQRSDIATALHARLTGDSAAPTKLERTMARLRVQVERFVFEAPPCLQERHNSRPTTVVEKKCELSSMHNPRVRYLTNLKTLGSLSAEELGP